MLKTIFFIAISFFVFCIVIALLFGDKPRTLSAGQGYYLGGCSKIIGNGYKIGCNISKDGFYISTPISKKIDLQIPINKIKKIDVKTETQIKEHVTLGRLCMLGVFAFLAPKKQNELIRYLVIEYENNNQIENILLQLDGQNTCNNFAEAFNNIKQLSNKEVPV